MESNKSISTKTKGKYSQFSVVAHLQNPKKDAGAWTLLAPSWIRMIVYYFTPTFRNSLRYLQEYSHNLNHIVELSTSVSCSTCSGFYRFFLIGHLSRTSFAQHFYYSGVCSSITQSFDFPLPPHYSTKSSQLKLLKTPASINVTFTQLPCILEQDHLLTSQSM